MKDIALGEVRNFVLLGHTQHGKTALLDAMLYELKVNDRLGSTDNGSSMADWMEEEKERKITIWPKTFNATFTTSDKHKSELVVTDTPGYAEFFGGVAAATRAADAGLIVIDAASGPQAGSVRAWKRCDDKEIPKGIVITGLDKENTDFNTTLSGIRERWGERCIPVLLPLPDNSGVFNILESKDIPEALEDQVEEYKTALLESAAETDDALIEKYLGGEELSKEEMANGLHGAVNARLLVPVFVAYPLKGHGIHDLLDAIHHLFPAPDYHEIKDEKGTAIPIGKDAGFSGLVWRMINDPFAGQITFVRVMSGTFKSDSEIYNSTRMQKERIGSLLIINGTKQESIAEAHAGDIVAVAKLKHTYTNDSLCDVGCTIQYPRIQFPEPVMHMAVHVAKKGEEDKMATALARAADEDPTIRCERNNETSQMILSGMGDIHLKVTLDHIKHRNNVELTLTIPKVPYRETIRGHSEGHYKHKKQSGGRGQYAEVYLRMEPLPEGEEEWFVNSIVGGAIPSNFIPAVEKGLVEAMAHGVVAGYKTKDLKITLYDGTFHDVDSSEVAFKIAASRAFSDAMGKAQPILLEPIVKLRIQVPSQFLGDITGDMSQRRGRVMGMEEGDGMQVILAEAPQSEVFRYASDLQSITGGQGTFKAKFERYESVPRDIAQKVQEAAKQEND